MGGKQKLSVDYEKSTKINDLFLVAKEQYIAAQYESSIKTCMITYEIDACKPDNLVLLGAAHYQLGNLSECIFFNQQCIRIDASIAEPYSNIGNALKELGDISGAIQFYLKAIKLKPRYAEAFNNLASAYTICGRIDDAIDTYQMATILDPNLADSYTNIGNLYKAKGNLEESKKSHMEALRINPEFAIAWNNLAGVMRELGQLSTAAAYYQEAIRLSPEFADAHNNLGNVLRDMGQLTRALQSYQLALSLRPNFAIAQGNLCCCYLEIGELDIALSKFQSTLQNEPNLPDVYNNYGNALKQANDTQRATECFKSALRLKPDHPYAYNNLGNALQEQGMFKEALHCYTTAIRLMPKFNVGHNNLAVLLLEQGRIDQAMAHLIECVSIDPMYAEAYNNLGNAHRQRGNMEEAVKCYATAISTRPTFAEAFCNLAAAYSDSGQFAEAAACYKRLLTLNPDHGESRIGLWMSLTQTCNWSERDSITQNAVDFLKGHCSSNPKCCLRPYHSLFFPLTGQELKNFAKIQLQRSVMLQPRPNFKFKVKPSGTKLSIGYVSSSFGNHPTCHMIQGLLSMHDRNKFNITAYFTERDDKSSWREAMESIVDNSVELVTDSAREAAQAVYRDKIDILINLDDSPHGLFVLRPAPIQMSFLGFPGTLGGGCLDYFISDHTCLPDTIRDHVAESVIYLPYTHVVNNHKQSMKFALNAELLPSRAAYGIPEDKFVFCYFGQLCKIDPVIFDTWIRILKRVPNSILWLLRFPPMAEANIMKQARSKGLDGSQILFSDLVPKQEQIARAYLADLYLDTIVLNSQTSACDTLWAGTPVLTLAGNRPCSRISASIVAAAGLPELITQDLKEYEDTAFNLANDVDKLFDIRQRLERSRESCHLFDTSDFAKKFEAGIDEAHNRYKLGLPLADIVIDKDESIDSKVF